MKDCCEDVFVSRARSTNVYYHVVSVANKADNLSLCGMLALLGWVVESVSVFRPSITVLREGRKGWYGGLFFRTSVKFKLEMVCQTGVEKGF